MVYNQHIPNNSIKPYIESIFHFKDFIPDHSIERVVPTGHIYLIFELDGIERKTFDNDSLKPINTFRETWISGMHKKHISISAHEHSEMLVVQFKAFGAYPFFHSPMEVLNEKIIPATEFFGDEIIELRYAIINTNTTEAKFNLIEKWLNKRFKEDKLPPKDLLSVIDKLQTLSVSNYSKIINEYPKTQKHLIDQFKKYVGLTPKYYQRILRFNEILDRINKKEKIEWSQVAYECEYADQSHFIKEFKHFSGLNPEEFIKQDFHQDDTNFFPID